ncbi:MAG: PAS domain S-box protein [Nitrospinae bacterium]|nr:PAS domain S-box protein [Nitrospinota bacterium]
MKLKIRTKFIIIFLTILSPILLITVIAASYSIRNIQKSIYELKIIHEELNMVNNLQLSLQEVIMPGNDYIITGDRKYLNDFQMASAEMEKGLKEAEGLLNRIEAEPLGIKEEHEILKDIKAAWQNIKDISSEIFAIPDPVADKKAARLMEEMDYKWSYPAIKKLKRWKEIDTKENKKTEDNIKKVLRMTWTIIIVSGIIMFISGLSFIFISSRRFTSPIEAIYKQAEAIAVGDFNERLDIKTGDEIEGLGNAMNKMAAQLKDIYSYLEGRVEQFRAITETSNDAVICIEETGIIVLWNKKAEEMFGFSADEAMGKDLHGLIVPERYHEKSMKGLKPFFETGTGPLMGKTIEQRALRRDGTEFPIELSIIAMKIKGKWQGAGIVRDISDRKQAEEKLKERLDELERFKKATVQREFRIKELSERVEELEKRMGKG